MRVTRDDIVKAARSIGLTEEQASTLWQALGATPEDQPGFHAAHVAYYLGALIVAGAMGWFVTMAFDRLSGGMLTLIALAYALVALLAARYFWNRRDLRILGGICATVAVCMTPLAIFGVEKALNLWPAGVSGAYYDFHPWIRASWVYMEIGTVIAGLVALRFFAFPFLTAPIAYALWYMSMDATALLFHKNWTFHQLCHISIVFGLVMLLVSYFIDHRTRDDYAFWGYLFGMMTLWGGLSLLDSGSQLARFAYGCLNLGFIAVSVLLNRRVFLVFGAIGVFSYLTSLAHTLFRDSLLFPFAVSLLGVAIIALGILLQKQMPRIKGFFDANLSGSVIRMLPNRRAG